MAKSCDYKIRFKTKEDAEVARENYLEAVVLTISPLDVYWCDKHKSWHLGHSLTTEQRRARWMSMNWWRLQS